MSYDSSDGSYCSSWPQQNSGQTSEAYLQNGHAYSSRDRQMRPQPDTDNSHYQYYGCDSGNPQYSTYSIPAARSISYAQSTTAIGDAHSTTQVTSGYTGAYQPGVYSNTLPQYSQPYGSQSQGWSDAQPSALGPGTQRMIQPPAVVPAMAYTSQGLPLVASRPDLGAGPEYGSSRTWPMDAHLGPGPSNLQYKTAESSTGGGVECTVPCPYGCGTILTGVHAVGNMTRHLKSQNCAGSGKDKTKYTCPVQGCDKRYIRSDGLKVHLRKRHNISEVPGRTNSSEYEEVG